MILIGDDMRVLHDLLAHTAHEIFLNEMVADDHLLVIRGLVRWWWSS